MYMYIYIQRNVQKCSLQDCVTELSLHRHEHNIRDKYLEQYLSCHTLKKLDSTTSSTLSPHFTHSSYDMLIDTFFKTILNDNTRVGGDSGPEVGALLGNGAGDGGSLHLTLGVDNDTGVVLEVEVDTILSSPGLGLSNNNGRHDLLSELGLTLLDGGHDHVTGTSGGQSVKSSTAALDGNDVQVSSTRVVSAVHDGSDGQGHLWVSMERNEIKRASMDKRFLSAAIGRDQWRLSGESDCTNAHMERFSQSVVQGCKWTQRNTQKDLSESSAIQTPGHRLLSC
jgi:hypothetical protein